MGIEDLLSFGFQVLENIIKLLSFILKNNNQKN